MNQQEQRLVLTVWLHEGRYHGAGDWPPSPARLFSALVAGSGPGIELAAEAVGALQWLERLEPPLIAAPRARRGQEVSLFVPNNDLDALGGDPARVGEIRVAKRVHPHLIEGSAPLLYIWAADDWQQASQVAGLAERLYQLGRGVDMAWAEGRVVTAGQVEDLLAGWPGEVLRPGLGGEARVQLDCPAPGTLDSLRQRYLAGTTRVAPGARGQQLFTQPPKPRTRRVGYGVASQSALYDLRPHGEQGRLAVWPLDAAARLAVAVRDAAAERLGAALPSLAATIERALIGRRVDGQGVPAAARVRVVPLPSIGHEHVDRGIRRVRVEVPADCPLSAADVWWALSGLQVPGYAGAREVVLTPSTDEGMLQHYGVGEEVAPAGRWRTITPIAVPADVAQAADDEARRAVVHAVTQAARHAGLERAPVAVQVQREPFEARGARAEAFAAGTRFAPTRLWHAELTFSEPRRGLMVLGDGRFLGLGVLAPVDDVAGIAALRVVEGLQPGADPLRLAEALRRAVMSRVRDILGVGPDQGLPAFFAGHEADGAASTGEPHLSYAADLGGRRLLVITPHAREHRRPRASERRHLRVLGDALTGFDGLRAGREGLLRLQREEVDPAVDVLLAPNTVWRTQTPYQVNRHLKRSSAEEVLVQDVLAACAAAGLPRPEVTVERARSEQGRGLSGHLRLRFAVAVPGPILLGRSRHRGGGLFVGLLPFD